MAQQKEEVFTNIDALVEYLNAHGETESSVLASTLGVTDKNIEDWSKLLERSKMAKITYKLGRMFVAPIGAQKSKLIPESQQIVDLKKDIVGSEVEAQLSDVTKISKRIEEFNKFVAISDNVMQTNSKTIKDTLGRLDKMQEDVTKSFGTIKSKKEEVDKFAQELTSMLDSLSMNIDRGMNLAGSSNTRTLIEDINAKIRLFRETSGKLMQEYDKRVIEERRKLVAFNVEIDKQIEKLAYSLRQEDERAKEYDKLIDTYSKRSTRIKRENERNKQILIDSVNKAKSDIDIIYNAAENEVNKIDPILQKARSGLSGFADMRNNLGDIKTALAEATKENLEIKTQLDTLSQQLKSASVTTAGEITDRDKAVANVEKDSKKAYKRISDNSDRVKKIGKKVEDFNSSQEGE